MQHVELMYDFGSPNAYLAHEVLKKIATRHSMKITLLPVLIGGVFKATNNQAPMMAFAEIPGKVEYMRVEMARFIERHQIPFTFNPYFPVNSLTIMRGGVFAQGKIWEKKYINAVFKAMWVEGEDMSDLNVVARVLTHADLPRDDIMNAMQYAEIKSNLVDLTKQAVARKVYGLPTMFLNHEMFFGKDSLGDLEWRLSQA